MCCPLLVFHIYSLCPQHHWAVTIVMATSPFQVLFHLAEISIPTIGGGVVSVPLEHDDLAIVTEISKQIQVY